MEEILAIGVAAGTAFLISETRRICNRTLKKMEGRKARKDSAQAQNHA